MLNKFQKAAAWDKSDSQLSDEERAYVNDPVRFEARNRDSVDIEKLGAMQHQSAWVDVQAKGKRIADSGGVALKHKRPYDIYKPEDIVETKAMVRGDHANYDVILHQSHPRSRSLRWWDCQCTWRRYVWRRRPKYVIDRDGTRREVNKKFEGRVCSHVLALWWVGSGVEVSYEDVPEDVLRQKLPEMIDQERLFPADLMGIKKGLERDDDELGDDENLDYYLDSLDLETLKPDELPDGDLSTARRDLRELEEQLDDLRTQEDSSEKRMRVADLEEQIGAKRKRIQYFEMSDLLNKSIQPQLDLYPAKAPLADYIDRIAEGNILSPKDVPKSVLYPRFNTDSGDVWTIGDRVITLTRDNDEGDSVTYNVTVTELAKAVKDAEENDLPEVVVRQRGQKADGARLVADTGIARAILGEYYAPRRQLTIEDAEGFLGEKRDSWIQAIEAEKQDLAEAEEERRNVEREIRELADTEDPEEITRRRRRINEYRRIVQEKKDRITYFSRLIYVLDGFNRLDTDETRDIKRQIQELKAQTDLRNDAQRTMQERQIRQRRDLLRQIYLKQVSDPFYEGPDFDPDSGLGQPDYYDVQPNIKAQNPVTNPDSTPDEEDDQERRSSIKHSSVSVLSSDYPINDITIYLQNQLARGEKPNGYTRRELWGERRGGLHPHPDAVPVGAQDDGNFIYSPDDLGYDPQTMQMGSREEERGTYGSIPVGAMVEITAVDPRDRLVLTRYRIENNPPPNHEYISLWVSLKDIDLI